MKMAEERWLQWKQVCSVKWPNSQAWLGQWERNETVTLLLCIKLRKDIWEMGMMWILFWDDHFSRYLMVQQGVSCSDSVEDNDHQEWHRVFACSASQIVFLCYLMRIRTKNMHKENVILILTSIMMLTSSVISI